MTVMGVARGRAGVQMPPRARIPNKFAQFASLRSHCTCIMRQNALEYTIFRPKDSKNMGRNSAPSPDLSSLVHPTWKWDYR